MVTVTPATCERLARRLARKKAGENEAVRVARRPGGWKLCIDHARPDDTAFAHDGRILLLLDEAASEAMARATLDVQDTGAGQRLKLR